MSQSAGFSGNVGIYRLDSDLGISQVAHTTDRNDAMRYQALMLASKWVGREVYGSKDNNRDEHDRHPREVTKVWHDPANGTFCALAREHHRCYDAKALDLLLESLAVTPTAVAR